LFTGGFEIVFILFIAFLLFGPKKLPEIARVLGKGLGELRRASNELRSSLEDEIRNLERDVENQRRLEAADPAPTPAHEFSDSSGQLTESVTDNGHDHREPVPGEPEVQS
jgi:TatA/E family protein of Tat protein translocase